MKLSCDNPNYCAVVIKIHNLVDLDGATNLVGLPAFGLQAIVSKDHNIGELGIIFSTETQLSHEFCFYNNLYKDKALNINREQSGYLDSNRRIKALKLIKGRHISTALFMPLSSLSYLGVNPEDFKEGDTFTHINGERVCEKYIVQIPSVKGKSNKIKGQTRKRIVDEKVFKQHVDTGFFLRNLKDFKDKDWIIVSEKIHSTSGRFGHIEVDRELKWYEKLAKKLGIRVKEKEYRLVCGSRRVVKIDGSEQSFYNTDVWKRTLEEIQHVIPKDVEIFGEIAGWGGDKPLQKDYTYCIPKGKTELYVYRIASVNEDGFMVDWSWEQVKNFCVSNGLKHVPELFVGYFKDFDYTVYEDKKFREELGLTQCLKLDPGAPCSEGVVVRKEDGSYIPYFTKFKNPKFYLHEGLEISAGRADIETIESLESLGWFFVFPF